MNGTQRTACLARGYNNDKYKLIEVLVTGNKPIEIENTRWQNGTGPDNLAISPYSNCAADTRSCGTITLQQREQHGHPLPISVMERSIQVQN